MSKYNWDHVVLEKNLNANTMHQYTQEEKYEAMRFDKTLPKEVSYIRYIDVAFGRFWKRAGFIGSQHLKGNVEQLKQFVVDAYGNEEELDDFIEYVKAIGSVEGKVLTLLKYDCGRGEANDKTVKFISDSIYEEGLDLLRRTQRLTRIKKVSERIEAVIQEHTNTEPTPEATQEDK